MVMSIDNLPTELAAESSNHFGSMLSSLIPKMVGFPVYLSWTHFFFQCPFFFARLQIATRDYEKLEPVIKRAVITEAGKLTPKFEYITELRKKHG